MYNNISRKRYITKDTLINPEGYKRLIIFHWLIMETEFRILIIY